MIKVDPGISILEVSLGRVYVSRGRIRLSRSESRDSRVRFY